MALIGYTIGIRELNASDGNVSFPCYILLVLSIKGYINLTGIDCLGAETSESH